MRALKGKDAYTVYHPYPVNFSELYKAMQPFCESTADQMLTGKSNISEIKRLEQLLENSL
jgi:hypothetical protein